MSESVVFELKLQIQHLEEKLTFLAGGTNGAELVEVLMEKDEELEKNSQRLKQMEAKMMQLVEGAKRLDAKRRELARHSEHQAIRMEGLEKELDRQLGISDDLRTQVSDTKQDLASFKDQLCKTQADMAAAEESALENLNAARAEASSLQSIVEEQRATISELQATKKGLENTVAVKDEEIKSMEQRKKDIVQRSREMKNSLESLLWDSQKSQSELKGQRSSLESELHRLRRRMDERAKISLEEERKATALARECGALKTELESSRQDIASTNEELDAVRASKSEADEALLAKDKENVKLRSKHESLKKDMDRRLHLANQEKMTLSDSMANNKRLFDEREATLCDQMKHMEKDSSALADALTEKVSQLEEQLLKAEEDGERLREEARALKEETSGKARRFEAAKKTEARWRARAESSISSQEAKLEELKAELVVARQQGADLRHVETENKELRGRIERQESFQRRRMEKEKKERRARSGLRASVTSSSEKAAGRGSVHLVPLPPPMNERKSTGDDGEGSNPGNDSSINHDGNDNDSNTSTDASVRDTPQSTHTSSSAEDKHAGSGTRSAKAATAISRRDGSDNEGGARSGGREHRGMRSVSPFARPSSASSSSRASAKFFSTPEYSSRNAENENSSRKAGKENSSRNAEKENRGRSRRGPAWGARSYSRKSSTQRNGGSAGDCIGVSDAAGGRGGGDGKTDDAADTREKNASAGKCNSQTAVSKSSDVLRDRTPTSATGDGLGSRPLENRKNRSVTRSPALESSEDARNTSRGRRPLATKSAAPRSSSLGKQTRVVTGWR